MRWRMAGTRVIKQDCIFAGRGLWTSAMPISPEDLVRECLMCCWETKNIDRHRHCLAPRMFAMPTCRSPEMIGRDASGKFISLKSYGGRSGRTEAAGDRDGGGWRTRAD